MKHAPIMLAALVPLAATAGEDVMKTAGVDKSKLDNATPVSEIIGETINTSDGKRFGDVEDVVLDRNGDVAFIAVEPEIDMYSATGHDGAPRDMDVVDDEGREVTYEKDGSGYTAGAGLDAERDDGMEGEDRGDENVDPGVDYSDAGNIDDREDETVLARAGMNDQDLVHVDPGSVQLDGGNIAIDMNAVKDSANRTTNVSSDQYRASELIGMEVNLSDEDSFGQVEDVLLDERATEAVALVVDNWEGVDKNRRALPFDAESIDVRNGEVNYSLASDDVKDVENVDLDNL